MIVNPVAKGWEIIYQSAHGMLAADLYLHLNGRPGPRLDVATLLAIAHHDDLQVLFEDDNYVTSVGAPKDFTLLSFKAGQRVEQLGHILQESYRKNTWTGLLISYHYNFLYVDKKVDEKMRRILDREKEKRKQLLTEMERKESELKQAYGLLRWCDRCSLILCRSQVPAMGRKLEINDGLGQPSFVFRNGEKTITIDPWCFTEEEFLVGTEVYPLEQLHFADDQELRKVLKDSRAEYRTWHFRRRK